MNEERGADERDPLLPFARRSPPPASLRPPAVIGLALAVALVAGVLVALLEPPRAPAYRLLRASFFASAFAYLVLSLFDFWEHFRLEKAATGKWWSRSVVPVGESLNHALTGAVIVLLLVLARPLPPRLEQRDWLVLAAPALFLLLGWRDEFVYHRRRCAHREDIMHTMAHLAAGIMIATFLTTSLFAW